MVKVNPSAWSNYPQLHSLLRPTLVETLHYHLGEAIENSMAGANLRPILTPRTLHRKMLGGDICSQCPFLRFDMVTVLLPSNQMVPIKRKTELEDRLFEALTLRNMAKRIAFSMLSMLLFF